MTPPGAGPPLPISGGSIVALVGGPFAPSGDLLVADLLSGVIRVNPADLSQTPVSSGGFFTVTLGS